MSDRPAVSAARFDLTGGDVLELTDYEGGPPAGVVRRLAPGGWARWVTDPGDGGDPFVDARVHGDEVVATTWQGRQFRIGLDDGAIRAVTFVK